MGVDARADPLGPPGPTETGYHGARPVRSGRRLGCAATIQGPAVIDIPVDSQVHRLVVRKDVMSLA